MASWTVADLWDLFLSAQKASKWQDSAVPGDLKAG